MRFSERLENFIGRTIEVYLQNEFYTGKLKKVYSHYFIIEDAYSSGYQEYDDVTIFIENIEFLKVMN